MGVQGPGWTTYQTVYANASSRTTGLPAMKQWMLQLSQLENAIAILTPRLVEEEMFAVAGRAGGERMSVYPSFRMYPSADNTIQFGISCLGNGWEITNLGTGDTLTVLPFVFYSPAGACIRGLHFSPDASILAISYESVQYVPPVVQGVVLAGPGGTSGTPVSGAIVTVNGYPPVMTDGRGAYAFAFPPGTTTGSFPMTITPPGGTPTVVVLDLTFGTSSVTPDPVLVSPVSAYGGVGSFTHRHAQHALDMLKGMKMDAQEKSGHR
jgi:hypothetical protein